MTRAAILTFLALLLCPQPALCGAHDACEWPEIEIKGLELDLYQTNRTLETLRKRKKNLDAIKGEEANAKRTQGEIDRFEKMEKELSDDLDKKRPAFEKSCR